MRYWQTTARLASGAPTPCSLPATHWTGHRLVRATESLARHSRLGHFRKVFSVRITRAKHAMDCGAPWCGNVHSPLRAVCRFHRRLFSWLACLTLLGCHLTSKEELARIAIQSETQEQAMSAAASLLDESALVDVATSSLHESVRCYATRKLTDLSELERIARNDESPQVRAEATRLYCDRIFLTPLPDEQVLSLIRTNLLLDIRRKLMQSIRNEVLLLQLAEEDWRLITGSLIQRVTNRSAIAKQVARIPHQPSFFEAANELSNLTPDTLDPLRLLANSGTIFPLPPSAQKRIDWAKRSSDPLSTDRESETGKKQLTPSSEDSRSSNWVQLEKLAQATKPDEVRTRHDSRQLREIAEIRSALFEEELVKQLGPLKLAITVRPRSANYSLYSLNHSGYFSDHTILGEKISVSIVRTTGGELIASGEWESRFPEQKTVAKGVTGDYLPAEVNGRELLSALLAKANLSSRQWETISRTSTNLALCRVAIETIADGPTLKNIALCHPSESIRLKAAANLNDPGVWLSIAKGDMSWDNRCEAVGRLRDITALIEFASPIYGPSPAKEARTRLSNLLRTAALSESEIIRIASCRHLPMEVNHVGLREEAIRRVTDPTVLGFLASRDSSIRGRQAASAKLRLLAAATERELPAQKPHR